MEDRTGIGVACEEATAEGPQDYAKNDATGHGVLASASETESGPKQNGSNRRQKESSCATDKDG